MALTETAGGVTVTTDEGDRHIQGFGFPGAAHVPAVIFYRTRHTGLPRFTVRLNHAPLTRYAFTPQDQAERCWHEIVPAGPNSQPTLKAQGNELVFTVSSDHITGLASVTFGDVVIMYTSHEVTVRVPFFVTTAGLAA